MATGANHLEEDVTNLGGPDEGFGIFVVQGDVFLDGGDQHCQL